MKTDLLLLTRLELLQLFGWNVQRHSRDPKSKKRWLLLGVTFGLLAILAVSYVMGLVWGLVFLGLESIVVSYLVAAVSLVIVVLGGFRAGSLLFSRKGYDILTSLPVSTRALVLSRVLRMYVEDLLLTVLLLLPGFGLFAFLTRPNFWFYLFGLVGILLIPGIPVVLAVMVGTALAALASRMKHKALAQTVLSLVLVLTILACSFLLPSRIGTDFSPEALAQMAGTLGIILNTIYPPAHWLSTAAAGNPLGLLAFLLISLAALLGMTEILSMAFHPIIQRLHSSSASHDFQMGSLASSGLRKAMVIRELRRYFASSIYVTNTILGPILATVFSGSLCLVDMDTIQKTLEIPFSLPPLIPFLFSSIFTMMPTTACSISMEGKELWIAQSLPISMKALLDGKIFMNLLLMMPWFLISQLLLQIALGGSLMTLVLPAVFALLAVVGGVFINLRLPNLHWETETYVVKQSASSMAGGFLGPLVSTLCGAVILNVPSVFQEMASIAGSLLLMALTGWMYHNSIRAKLHHL